MNDLQWLEGKRRLLLGLTPYIPSTCVCMMCVLQTNLSGLHHTQWCTVIRGCQPDTWSPFFLERSVYIQSHNIPLLAGSSRLVIDIRSSPECFGYIQNPANSQKFNWLLVPRLVPMEVEARNYLQVGSILKSIPAIKCKSTRILIIQRQTRHALDSSTQQPIWIYWFGWLMNSRIQRINCPWSYFLLERLRRT